MVAARASPSFRLPPSPKTCTLLGRRFEEMGEDGAVVDRVRRHLELGLDEREGLFSHIREGMEDRHQVLILNHQDFLIFLEGGNIDLFQGGTVGRRPEDLGVEHAGQPDVPRESGLSGHLLDAVQASEGGAHELEFRRLLLARLGLKVFLDNLALTELGIGTPVWSYPAGR